MSDNKKEEKTKLAIEQINKILGDNGLMIVPIVTIVGNEINQRCEIMEKPKKSNIIKPE